MNRLTTHYLGLDLRNPVVISSSPLTETIADLRRLEDCGAAAVVLPSLFEEQIALESSQVERWLTHGAESYAESLTYLPDMSDYNLGPDDYLNLVRQAKESLGIPVIASLNGSTPGGWTRFAQLMEQAGADALELNLYHLPTDIDMTAAMVEQQYVELVRSITSSVSIPVAVKLGSQFTAPANLARHLDEAGARGLVLFNRFYQPDFDLEHLDVTPRLWLSRPGELMLRLHWVAIIYGHIGADLAVTGGVYSGTDVVKCMMAGARVAMTTSALLRHGIEHLRGMLAELQRWLDEHEYESIRQMQGSMSFRSAPNPAAFERGNYLQVLRSYMFHPRHDEL